VEATVLARRVTAERRRPWQCFDRVYWQRNQRLQTMSGAAKKLAESPLALFNPLMGTGNCSATSNNMKLVHWPLMGGLLQCYIWYNEAIVFGNTVYSIYQSRAAAADNFLFRPTV